MTMSRLEEVIHAVVVKPIAWTLYGLWQGLRAISRAAMKFGRWVRERRTEYRIRRMASRPVA